MNTKNTTKTILNNVMHEQYDKIWVNNTRCKYVEA